MKTKLWSFETETGFHLGRSRTSLICGQSLVGEFSVTEFSARADECAGWPEWCEQCFARLRKIEAREAAKNRFEEADRLRQFQAKGNRCE